MIVARAQRSRELRAWGVNDGSPLQTPSPGPQAHSTQSAHGQLVAAVGPPGQRTHLQAEAAGIWLLQGLPRQGTTCRACTVS